MSELFELIRKSRVYDLGQPYFVGMPHHPSHPPFLFSLSKKHGDLVSAKGISSAAEAIALGGHVGTHIDALCHFSCGGKLHGGVDAAAVQSYGGGIRRYSVDTIAPILRRAVLLDIAGAEPLPVDFAIGPEHLDRALERANVEIHSGDIVLLRTGWGSFFREPERFLRQVQGPGPAIDGARWLSTRRIFAAGADTIAFERVPDPDMPVHVHLLFESGIHIIECLNLEELARDGVSEFVFVGAPLKLEGGTGAPLRPLALA
jgi:kynurenine formamidase